MKGYGYVYNFIKEHDYLDDSIVALLHQSASENYKPITLAKIEIIYQTIEDLHIACPENLGDWYFTGNYPTPGGNRVVNTAFVNFFEGNKKRAY